MSHEKLSNFLKVTPLYSLSEDLKYIISNSKTRDSEAAAQKRVKTKPPVCKNISQCNKCLRIRNVRVELRATGISIVTVVTKCGDLVQQGDCDLQVTSL